jgi:hypothetical protein
LFVLLKAIRIFKNKHWESIIWLIQASLLTTILVGIKMALNIWTTTGLLQEIRGYLTVWEINFATDNTGYYKQTVVIQSDEYN